MQNFEHGNVIAIKDQRYHVVLDRVLLDEKEVTQGYFVFGTYKLGNKTLYFIIDQSVFDGLISEGKQVVGFWHTFFINQSYFDFTQSFTYKIECAEETYYILFDEQTNELNANVEFSASVSPNIKLEDYSAITFSIEDVVDVLPILSAQQRHQLIRKKRIKVVSKNLITWLVLFVILLTYYLAKKHDYDDQKEIQAKLFSQKKVLYGALHETKRDTIFPQLYPQEHIKRILMFELSGINLVGDVDVSQASVEFITSVDADALNFVALNNGLIITSEYDFKQNKTFVRWSIKRYPL